MSFPEISMSKDKVLVRDFRPLFLTVASVGPFREAPYELDFTNSGPSRRLRLSIGRNPGRLPMRW